MNFLDTVEEDLVSNYSKQSNSRLSKPQKYQMDDDDDESAVESIKLRSN